ADRDRVYTVGHGSAASLALRAGAELEQVKAIVAFNPITDIDGRISAFRRELRQIDRRAIVILRESSPLEHLLMLRTKPVFLFHSVADEAVPVAESARLALALKPGVDTSRVMIVPTGGHRPAMLEQGIPAALSWLDDLADPQPASHAAR
ncbi:MAG: prolyl oligopeptidase family serine peptidase, partial [Deltaproteobacteria bacterium]|nr:prolyl oligopeptidase family serine peptidase [Nannocystaceae bacterium]